MGKVLFTLIFCLAVFGVPEVKAQWQEDATITSVTLRGREYEYAKKTASVRLYRPETWPAKAYQVYKADGGKPYSSGLGPDPYIKPANFYGQMMQIYESTFSSSEKQLARGDMLVVIVYFDTSTGNVIGVAFDFNGLGDGWSRVPLEQLAKFDENIMAANFKFTITEEGARRNYLQTTWAVTPE